MKQWHEILSKVWTTGGLRADRTGVGTYSLFGEMLKFENVGTYFPAVTTKQSQPQPIGRLDAPARGVCSD